MFNASFKVFKILYEKHGCIKITIGANIKFSKINRKIATWINWYNEDIFNECNCLHCKVNGQSVMFQRRQMSLKGERVKK